MSNEKTSERNHTPDPSAQAFTVFSHRHHIYFTYLLGYLTLASSLTATIYLPLIEDLSKQYNASIFAIDLTITLYLVLQALSPAFFGPMSDTLGRRPVFLITFSIYCAASLGLALNKNSYVALMILRSLQSIGGSAVMSLAYAVVADISIPAQRGKILGPMLASTNFGPCFGPVLGGGIVLSMGQTQWCFWTLVIFGISSFMMIGWTMPETARRIVGNGAVQPQGIWKTWWSFMKPSRLEDRDAVISAEPTNGVNVGKNGVGVWTLPNPLSSVRLLFYADTALTLWSAASPYAVWYCIQASIPLIYGQQYGYNSLAVSLCFLSGGAGVILGGFIAGRLLDFNYKKTAAKHNLPIDRVSGDDLHSFPIEAARSRVSYILHTLSIGALVGYGWAVERRAHQVYR
jgi:multidrug resistance protein